MDKDIFEIVEILENLVEDEVPHKAKLEIEFIVSQLKAPLDSEKLMKIQDELEYVSNFNNIDSFVRNEIINIVSKLETLI